MEVRKTNFYKVFVCFEIRFLRCDGEIVGVSDEGDIDGSSDEGDVDGVMDGYIDGFGVVGNNDGLIDGLCVGFEDVGYKDGTILGDEKVGKSVGELVDGIGEGYLVGNTVFEQHII